MKAFTCILLMQPDDKHIKPHQHVLTIKCVSNKYDIIQQYSDLSVHNNPLTNPIKKADS